MDDVVNPEKYKKMLALQVSINEELTSLYEEHYSKGREHLSKLLVNQVEKLVERLNERGANFGCTDYGGDIDFENSEQTYSDGEKMGQGVVLYFRGFSCQVRWEGKDRYTEYVTGYLGSGYLGSE